METAPTRLVTRSGKSYARGNPIVKKSTKKRKAAPSNKNIQIPKFDQPGPEPNQINDQVPLPSASASPPNKKQKIMKTLEPVKPDTPKADKSKMTKSKRLFVEPTVKSAEEEKRLEIDDENYSTFGFSIQDELFPNHFFETNKPKSIETRRYFQKQGELKLSKMKNDPKATTKFEAITDQELKMIMKAIPKAYGPGAIEARLKSDLTKTLESISKGKCRLGKIGHILVSCDTHDLDGNKIEWEDAEENLYCTDPPKYHNGIIMELKLTKGNIVKARYYKDPQADYIFQ